MPRYQLTREDRQKGGRNQPREAKVLGGQRGFQTTMDRHPFFARKWLKKIIRGNYVLERNEKID